jgi:Xaa-Pro aminopeptidase
LSQLPERLLGPHHDQDTRVFSDRIRSPKIRYRNISGYSLGYYQHFTCRSSDFSYTFRPNDRWKLRENMVLHMYTVGKGLAFNETVVVTEDGGERLTRTPRKLLSVPMTNVA